MERMEILLYFFAKILSLFREEFLVSHSLMCYNEYKYGYLYEDLVPHHPGSQRRRDGMSYLPSLRYQDRRA